MEINVVEIKSKKSLEQEEKWIKSEILDHIQENNQ